MQLFLKAQVQSGRKWDGDTLRYDICQSDEGCDDERKIGLAESEL